MAVTLQWPFSAPAQDGYQAADRPTFLREDWRGVATVLKLSETTLADLSLVFELERQQAADFEGFFWTQDAGYLASGTRWVRMPLLIDGAVTMREVNFLGQFPEAEFMDQTVRFTASVAMR